MKGHKENGGQHPYRSSGIGKPRMEMEEDQAEEQGIDKREMKPDAANQNFPDAFGMAGDEQDWQKRNIGDQG